MKYTSQQLNSMTDRELLAAFVDKISPSSHEYDAGPCIARNGRWGICGDCPIVGQSIRPEDCAFTDRIDHNIHATHDDKFFGHDNEIPRATLIEVLSIP